MIFMCDLIGLCVGDIIIILCDVKELLDVEIEGVCCFKGLFGVMKGLKVIEIELIVEFGEEIVFIIEIEMIK